MSVNIRRRLLVQMLINVCVEPTQKCREASDKLYILGFYRSSVACLKRHAQLYVMLARQQGAALATTKHDFYIEVGRMR